MNILEQTHYPNKVCYDFDDEPFKIGTGTHNMNNNLNVHFL